MGGGYGGRPNLLYGKLCSEDQLQQLGVSLDYVPPEDQLSSAHRTSQQPPAHGKMFNPPLLLSFSNLFLL